MSQFKRLHGFGYLMVSTQSYIIGVHGVNNLKVCFHGVLRPLMLLSACIIVLQSCFSGMTVKILYIVSCEPDVFIVHIMHVWLWKIWAGSQDYNHESSCFSTEEAFLSISWVMSQLQGTIIMMISEIMKCALPHSTTPSCMWYAIIVIILLHMQIIGRRDHYVAW